MTVTMNASLPDDDSDEPMFVAEVDLSVEAPLGDDVAPDEAPDPYEIAAARRSDRGLPPLSPDDATRAPNIRVRSTMIDALDLILDGLLDDGIAISRSEFFEFATWHVVGMEPDLAYAIRRWRMAGGHRRPERRKGR